MHRSCVNYYWRSHEWWINLYANDQLDLCCLFFQWPTWDLLSIKAPSTDLWRSFDCRSSIGGGLLSHFSLNEAIGAYLVANVLVILLGASGLIDKVMKWIPLPIVMGMIVGVMIRFATEMIKSVTISPLLAGSAIIVFLLSSRFLKKVSPVLSALIVAVLLAVVTNSFHFKNVQEALVLPHVVIPTFSLNAIISIGIPLALLIIFKKMPRPQGY